ncbi:MAG: DUF3332 domain-containing protein [Prevotella sp.]|nr:DUF3332 domain-containing protein [Prevotella sp.]
MKKNSFKVIVLLAIAGVLTTSCVGSFPLFNKLASWNKRATNSKFLNEIIFLIISPAYGFCLTADALVLNSIEFWTGKNPLAHQVGKTINVKGQDGLMYAVETLKDGYKITNPDGKVYQFIYDQKTDAWTMDAEGMEREIFRFNPDGTIRTRTTAGQEMDLTLDASGLWQAKMFIDGSSYAMSAQ